MPPPPRSARAPLVLAGLALAAACAGAGAEIQPDAGPGPPAAPGPPRFAAVLVQVSASLDGRPLPLTREIVKALARDLAARGIFRRVDPPEAADSSPDAARVAITERYVSERRAGHGRVSGELEIRVEAPGADAPWIYAARAEASQHHQRGRAGETREALIARVQQANLDAASARMRADARLF